MADSASRIRRLRQKISRIELADVLGISPEAIGKWEIGRNHHNQDVLNNILLPISNILYKQSI